MKRWMSLVLLIAMAIALVGCVGEDLAPYVAELDSCKVQIAQLQERMDDLESQLKAYTVTESPVVGKPVEEIIEEKPERTVNVGDYVIFGEYEQDADRSTGKEPIEWMVLDVQDNQMLVISKYGLDCASYNTVLTSVTWENCSLRDWLNNEFLDSAFSDDEQSMIRKASVPFDSNPYYNPISGNSTKDNIFILSATETNKYFMSDYERQCQPTPYAVSRGEYVKHENGCCYWWLRTPGWDSQQAADMSNNGKVRYDGMFVSFGFGVVRPALWIDVNSEFWTLQSE